MQNDKKFVVITSIFSPTAAVLAFTRQKGWKVIVVGDDKSPKDWHLDEVIFLPIEEQSKSGFCTESLLPRNHYARKNIGYLTAMRAGAEIIFDTDDDNHPLSNWGIEPFAEAFLLSASNMGFVNIYKSFTTQTIWPRGFPLERLSIADANSDLHVGAVIENIQIGVWQGLTNGDPDVDAIYRMTVNEHCNFDTREPIVLGKDTFCPFNSQNTSFRKEIFPLLYLPSTVTFRFTDILRGLIAQPIMQAAGYYLGFHSATVVQERNPHVYLRDFEQEVPCYLYAQKVIEIVSSTIQNARTVTENLIVAYKQLAIEKIVTIEEVSRVIAWVKDITDCTS
ncbi:MAG: STELLO glycosyltransferase family protein [Kiritimatiellae bacterium]|nr:STELLO glycosyltransferase family protein [Kiritimatiellia bacterium]MDD5521804.1 STELLO glycosyltransferase family protein [Kiritimatiellia bacterium]